MSIGIRHASEAESISHDGHLQPYLAETEHAASDHRRRPRRARGPSPAHPEERNRELNGAIVSKHRKVRPAGSLTRTALSMAKMSRSSGGAEPSVWTRLMYARPVSMVTGTDTMNPTRSAMNGRPELPSDQPRRMR